MLNLDEQIKALSVSESADFSQIAESMKAFIDDRKTLIISSLGVNCVASYAPFVRKGDDFYILISEVAPHYKSIASNADKVQIMFIEDENSAKTIFARRRVSFDAKVILKDEREKIFSEFEAKFVSERALGVIKQMRDFHIFRVEISRGRLVNGFGAAYDTQGLSVISRVGGAMPHDIKK